VQKFKPSDHCFCIGLPFRSDVSSERSSYPQRLGEKDKASSMAGARACHIGSLDLVYLATDAGNHCRRSPISALL
jgi:hypothetical protein